VRDAAVIYAPLAAVIPNMGEPFLVECFVVVVIGGLGSFPGAVVGGIVVGEILSLTTLSIRLTPRPDLRRDDAGADRAAAACSARWGARNGGSDGHWLKRGCRNCRW